MHPDVQIHSLRIQVDPADSTYMPAVILINVGDSMHNLRELATINLAATNDIVTLMSNAKVSVWCEVMVFLRELMVFLPTEFSGKHIWPPFSNRVVLLFF